MRGLNLKFNKRPGFAGGEGMPGRITPQAKMIQTGDKFGNFGLAKQQGTTRIIYDSLPLDGSRTFRFFEGANARQFPFTNLNQDGGKLGVGEVMVMERCYLNFFEVDPLTGAILGVTTINNNLNFIQGELNFLQGNSRVLKRLKLTSFASEFNKEATFGQDAVTDGYTVFHFDSLITIQPQLEFIAEVNVAFQPAVANTFVQIVIEGTGGILSPKNVF